MPKRTYLCVPTVISLALLTSYSSTVKTEDTTDNTADNLLIVDCLLPGTIRQFGTRLTMLSARRAVRTSGAECAQRGGEFTPAKQANADTGLKVWLPLAQGGDTQAEIIAGELYESKGNYATAIELYSKAASKGSARAKTNLGNLSERGLGTAPNKQKAINLYGQAVGLGSNYLTAKSAPSIRKPLASMPRRNSTATPPKRQDTQQAKQSVAQAKAVVEQKKVKVEQIKKQIQQAPTNRMPKPAPQAVEKPSPPSTSPISKQTPSRTARDNTKETLKKELQRQEAEIKLQAIRIQQAEKELAALENAQATGKTPAPPKPMPIASAPEAPKIEISQPPISALRSIGKPKIPLASDNNPTTILGKVSPVKDIDKLLVNNQSANYDSNGNFTTNISVNPGGTEVSIRAINTVGKSTDLSFILMPPERTENPVITEAAPTSSATNVADSGSAASGVNFGQYYALVIGNANYQNHPTLTTAINDAEAIASTLQSRYGFRTAVLKDASRLKILDALDKFRHKLGENDNLLIYYAGHGSLEGGSGYWLPTDASSSDKGTWISNNQITSFLETMSAKHVLVVADSCYSGTLSQSAIPRPQLGDTQKSREWYQAVAKTKSRVVLSSGGVKPVLDIGGGNHSVFANAFLGVLNSGMTVLEGARLYDNLKDQVSSNARKSGISQNPQFAPIRFAGHEAGDFVFLKNGQVALYLPEQPYHYPEEPNSAPTVAATYNRWLLGLKIV